MEECSIGKLIKSQCHEQDLIKTYGLKNLEELSVENRQLLILRAGLEEEGVLNEGVICFHHEQFFLHRYTSMQRRCSDPFKKHKSRRPTRDLRVISLDSAKVVRKETGHDIKPGQKVCRSCEKKIGTLCTDIRWKIIPIDLYQTRSKKPSTKYFANGCFFFLLLRIDPRLSFCSAWKARFNQGGSNIYYSISGANTELVNPMLRDII